MRVCHIITRMIVGGAQENTLYNCRDLIEQYHDDVLLLTGPSLGPEGSLLEQGRGVAVPTEVIPSLRRSIHPWHDLQAYRAIRRSLARYRPDVVHTHSAKAGILGRFAAWSLGIPAIVHTVHGAPFYPTQSYVTRTFYQMCERSAARRCHALISVADAMTDLMVDAKIAPREKFTTISSGMEVEPLLKAQQHRARRRKELGLTDSDIVIGKIARLFELKGHDDVIAAARRVVAQAPQVKFLFVGDGILRQSLEQQIAAAGLTKHFLFTGLVPPSTIPEQIAAMDLLVHASLREGLARALPQALIAGIPVVSYDIDGAREVTLHDQTGYLIAPRDVDALATALLRLASDENLRRKLGQHGQQRFADQFRHETMTRSIRELYERVLATNRP
ncbi:glycosyl transferase group 1 [Pirellula staleyi DSM 6068]|uniref:Glycosyl transferase group 1 n=1 Tax=Pirellula staleyi (strain ATCC 27377 / DSM 6068 / ICPB 4128) TaxID=530564 RepID=D2R419_PIRSD|nr:glycosyltransferase family 4 protein [Pirellula staleyi]ADB18868.1 glycosyl transferase group 1 [Pirellula staleyi DSM 6068]